MEVGQSVVAKANQTFEDGNSVRGGEVGKVVEILPGGALQVGYGSDGNGYWRVQATYTPEELAELCDTGHTARMKAIDAQIRQRLERSEQEQER